MKTYAQTKLYIFFISFRADSALNKFKRFSNNNNIFFLIFTFQQRLLKLNFVIILKYVVNMYMVRGPLTKD